MAALPMKMKRGAKEDKSRKRRRPTLTGSALAALAGAKPGAAAAPRRGRDAEAEPGFTRVIVSGLPKKCDAALLRRHFGIIGEITDVALPCKDGDSAKSRGFAFVGFSEAATAAAAVAKLDRTYMGSWRISVRAAKKREALKEAEPAAAPEPEFAGAPKKAKVDDAPKVSSTRRERFFELMNKKGGGLEAARAEDHLELDRAADEEMEEDSEKPAMDAQLSDLDYLKQMQKTAALSDSDESDDEKDAETLRNPPPAAKNAAPAAADDDSDDGDDAGARLYVTNVAFGCSEAELEAEFSKFGKVVEVHAPLDPTTKQPRGFAFVRFVLPEAAAAAQAALHGKDMHGRSLGVVDALVAKQKPAPVAEDGEETSKYNPARTFSAKREEERRKRATEKEVGWHAAHVRSDTVGAAAAAELGVSKRDLFDATSSGEAAVTLALAESALQTQTSSFFKDHGYELIETEATKKKKLERSRTAVLVKNLPHATTAAELRELFVKAGEVERVLCAPSGASAIVEFKHATEARAAFKRLAYRRFKHVPLYLEWAPLPRAVATKAVHAPEAPAASASHRSAEEDDAAPPPSDGATLFVKNINFETTAAALRAHFQDVAVPRAVNLPPPLASTDAADDDKKAGKKEAPRRPRNNRGYGFIEFASEADARNALEARQGSTLDKHALALALTQAKPVADDHAASSSKAARQTKLVVRNLAFATTPNDVRALFAAFGELTKVRLPKRFDGRHRGFAFVCFAAARDAKRALESLTAAHLYGRHLVVEYAAEDKKL